MRSIWIPWYCGRKQYPDVYFGSNVQSYNRKKKPSLTGFQDLPVFCSSVNNCCVLYFLLLLFSALLPGQLQGSVHELAQHY